MADTAGTPRKYPRTPLLGKDKAQCRAIVPPAPGGWTEPALFEWELSAESWTDEHPHTEYNFVIEGRLFVESGGVTVAADAGDVVQVPAGAQGRYWAPEYARMLAIYGPSDGRPSRVVAYEKRVPAAASGPQASPKKMLLIGASRGLGLALAEEYLRRGWHVVATERGGTPSKLHGLRDASGGRLEIETVDIVHPDQVLALRDRLASRTFNLLFVNAGTKNDDRETIADVSTDEFIRVMVTNALSPLRVVETLQALVPPGGTIAIMSSGQGSITNNENGNYDVYRGSKAALNMFMRSFAARHAGEPRTLLLMAPGWVQTDMGGPQARLTIADSIPNLANTLDAQAGKAGLQYLDYLGRTVPW